MSAQKLNYRRINPALFTGAAAVASSEAKATAGAFGRIIRVDGTEEPLDRKPDLSDIGKRIGAYGVDFVRLRHLGNPAQIMIVDDTGALRQKPVNAKATALYHANCRPGTTHQIVGDVAIIFDRDLA